MTEQNPRPLSKPTVSGVQPDLVHDLGSPRIEVLARLAVAGGTLTPREIRDLCAAVVAHLDGSRA